MTKAEQPEADFSAFFLKDSSKLELTTPQGEPLLYEGKPVVVHVYGPATAQFKKAEDAKNAEATRRVVAQMAKNKKKDDGDPDADAKFLCAITDHFENFPFPGGAEAIYREPKLRYIHDQVQRFVGDMGNFFGNGGKA